MQEIKAAVCREFGKPLTIETVLLRAPIAGEVEVTLDACAICFSDISAMEGGWDAPLPAIYGHEAAGRITAMGEGVKGYDIGDKVIVTLIRSCGHCGSCSTGARVHCEVPYDRMTGPLSMPDGSAVQHGLNCGAFAEKVVVLDSQIAKVPDDMPSASASLMACGVATGMGSAINTAKVRPGETVVVIGAGGVGLAAIQGARIAGAARIIAIDMLQEKLDGAIELGATDAILATEEKPWRKVKAMNGRGADHVLVTVGAKVAYDHATKYLARGGSMTMVGMPHDGVATSYEPAVIAATGQKMLGALMGDTVLARDIPWMCDMYQQGRLKLDEMVTATWSLDQINEAVADTKSGSARRNVIVF